MKLGIPATSNDSTVDKRLWGERLRRSDYVEHLLKQRTVNLPRPTLRLLEQIDGRRRLSDLAKDLLLAPAEALAVARELIAAGYLQRPDAPPPSRDPLPPEMRENVRRLRPILVRFAGQQAAFALEVDAPNCATMADLIVATRRRFADPAERDRFTQAVMTELQLGPGT
jgi:hypothetical protein